MHFQTKGNYISQYRRWTYNQNRAIAAQKTNLFGNWTGIRREDQNAGK